jgi:hypothetical protein
LEKGIDGFHWAQIPLDLFSAFVFNNPDSSFLPAYLASLWLLLPLFGSQNFTHQAFDKYSLSE